MPGLDIADVPGLLGPGDRIAGIDLGTRTIGLAVSDAGLSFAHPRAVIARKKFTLDAEKLLSTLKREQAAVLVVGLPVNMDGSEGPRVQATRAFMRNLEKIEPVPFVFWDERLSTVAAERVLIEMDVSRKRREDRIDSAAAAFILQGALDRLRAMARQTRPSPSTRP